MTNVFPLFPVGRLFVSSEVTIAPWRRRYRTYASALKLRSLRTRAWKKRSAHSKVSTFRPIAVVFVFPPCPTEFTSSDVRGENRKLVERLKNCISLETVKTVLEKKDEELASAWKDASRKTKEAEDKLKSAERLEEERKTLEVAAKKAKEEIAELKKSYAEWETKLERVTAKKLEMEQFIEEFGKDASEKLKGKALPSDSCIASPTRTNFVCL